MEGQKYKNRHTQIVGNVLMNVSLKQAPRLKSNQKTLQIDGATPHKEDLQASGTIRTITRI